MASQNPTRGTRFPDETEEDFQKFRDQNDMNNSEALRELVRTGLSEKRADPLDDRPNSLLAGLLWDARRDMEVYVFITVACYALATLTTGFISGVLMLLFASYGLTVGVGAVDALVLDSRFTLWLMDLSDSVTVEVEA